jgi:hypothetical protein
MMTEKGYSSSCPGRFRTIIQEDNEEEIISPATNAGDDVDSDERSVSEHRTYPSRRDTSEAVWKRFRLLSVISLVRHISNSPMEEDPPAATSVDDSPPSPTSLYNHYASSLTEDEEPNSQPHMQPWLVPSLGSPRKAYRQDELDRYKAMVLAEWEKIEIPRRISGVPHNQIHVEQVRTQITQNNIDLPRRIPDVSHTQIQFNQIPTRITQNNRGRTFLKEMWSKIAHL